jgi:ketosteroid isomerase-like protein
MTDDHHVTRADLDQLVDLMADAASAFIGGEMPRYFELIKHADDYTLMSPTGGDTIHGVDTSDAAIAEAQRFFRRGQATLEVAQTYASGDLAVLVVVERQHGDVGDYPAQDWSLRVTLVFRRTGAGWELAHRHADPLVHPITMDQVAVLARGAAS